MALRSLFRSRPPAPATAEPPSVVADPGPAPDPVGPSSEARLVIAEAERLEEAGRHREAIDLLTEANRQSQDIRFERRLVNLRHRTFDTLDRSGGRDHWPPEYDDLFPDVHGVPPEVQRDEVTPEVLGSAMVNHGCLLVRGLVAPDRVAPLIDAIDRAFDGYDAHLEGVPVADTSPWYVPFSPLPKYPIGKGRPWVRAGGGVYTVDSPRAMFGLLETLDETGVGAAIEGYMGERPALSVKKSTLRRVPVDTGTDWHQDGAFIGQGIRSCNVWITLTDCGVDAPGLDIVPRRVPEVVPTGVEGAVFDWSVGQAVVDRAALDTPVIRPQFAAGDALLFDDVFLHRTGVSPGMTTVRYAIESWFFAPSTYPVEQVPIAY